MSVILTADEIKRLYDAGQRTVHCEEAPVLTDLAKELLERLDVKIVVGGKLSGERTEAPAATPPLAKEKMKNLLNSGRKLCGTFMGTPHPSLCEVVGKLGFDFLLIDSEHSAMSIETVQSMLMATELTPACGTVRVPTIAYEYIAGMLDSGAEALLIPQVRTVEDVVKIRDYSMYPPAGKRGIGPGRASSYGMSIMEKAKGNPNADTCVMLQIETLEALENLEAIAEFNFFDLLFVGPGDLSMNLGVFGQFDHPMLKDAIDRVFAVCQKRGKKSGIFAGNMQGAEKWFHYGFDMVVVNSEIGLLAEAVRSGLSSLRRALRQPK
jgi:4-hydroxy-2-oxoheptanedioate aldolase